MSPQIRDKKHLVTGGAGFIGSHLIQALLAGGGEVTALDNLSSSRLSNLQFLRDTPRFRLAKGDLLDPDRVKEAVRGQDVVWHFGANTNMMIGRTCPKVDFDNGIVATYHLLEAIRHEGVSELIFPSSGAVYGHIKNPPAGEDYGPLIPLSMYGAAKLAAEGMISAYSELFGLRSWIFRFGNVIGPRMSHGIIYDFIRKLSQNPKELEILGDGKGEKNYILVEECVDGMLFAYQHCKIQCEIFNLGSPSTTQVLEIAHIVVEEMGLTGVTYRFTGGAQGWPGDQPVVLMDVRKMARLGWRSRHTSNEAVQIATRRYLARPGA